MNRSIRFASYLILSMFLVTSTSALADQSGIDSHGLTNNYDVFALGQELTTDEMAEVQGELAPIVAFAVIQGGRVVATQLARRTMSQAARMVVANTGRYKGVLAGSRYQAYKIAKAAAKQYKKTNGIVTKTRVYREIDKNTPNARWHYHIEYKRAGTRGWKKLKTHVWY